MLTNKPDKDALSREPDPIVEGFRQLQEQQKHAYDLVRDLRDSVGGHVLHSDVQEVLRGLDRDTTGFFQDGEIRGTIRYKFASELVLSMMLDKVEPRHEQEKLETLLGETAKLIFIIGTIDQIVRAYIVDRRLLTTP
jgi:hypothetical protein